MIKRIKSIAVGYQGSNIYFVENEKGDSIMIDCGHIDERVEKFIESEGFSIKSVLLTHGHFDHIEGLKYAVNRHIGVLIGRGDEKMLSDDTLNLSTYFGVTVPHIKEYKIVEEGVLDLDGFSIRVIETPGHTSGSVCYLIEDKLFSGDTLFKGTYGRCDLPTGNRKEMLHSLNKLFSIGDDVKVYPGHGEPTDIGSEKILY